MAKKKRLKQLSGRAGVEEAGKIDPEQTELTPNVNNNNKNIVSNDKTLSSIADSSLSNTTSNTTDVSRLFAASKTPVSKTVIASTSSVSDSKNMNGSTPVDKPVRPPKSVRQTPDGAFFEAKTPTKISSAKQRKLNKETVRNKMEQKMNMKKKIKDPRLIPRMKEYLESRVNKNFVSIPLMADYLQQKYPEYGRKKKSMFVQYVDKAYSYMEKPFCDPPPPLSDTDEDSNTEKELVEENGRYVWKNVSEHSREKPEDEEKGEDVFQDSSDDDDSNLENLVEYKDTNSTNNRLRNMYMNSPTHVSKSNADEKKRKIPEATPINPKRSKSDSKVLYPSPNVLERNMASTGLVGPRRSSSDKYFIDRKGDDSAKKVAATTASNPEYKDSREVTIQKFLGNLPSRTSFSSYVSGTNKDPRLKSGTLYRVFTGKTEEEEMFLHSGVTDENVGTTISAPQSPSAGGHDESETPDEVDPDPRIRIEAVDEKSGQSTGKIQRSSAKAKQTKSSKKRPIPRHKKGGSSARNLDMSETEADTGTGPSFQKSSVKFADVGGNEKTLIEICKLLVHMRHPEVYCRLGVTPPRGFLLHGPPGCGKTLLANAIAGELDLPLMKIAATEIVSGVSGDSEEKIRGLFEKASQNAPCVVFIDEIDSITPKRETASKDMERRIVAQLLACMDDLNANPGCHVLVIGATNRPDSLDPALRRAGRFDREICLGIPDEASRLRILEVLCRNLRLSSEFDFSYLAHNTPGYVGADLMALTREAAMTAVNRVFQSLQSETPHKNSIYSSIDSSLLDDPRGSDIDRQSGDKILTNRVPTNNASNCSPFLIPLDTVSQSQTIAVQSSNAKSTDLNISGAQNGESEIISGAPNGDCGSNSTENLLTWSSKKDIVENGSNTTDEKVTMEKRSVINADKEGLSSVDDIPKEICDVESVTEKLNSESGDHMVLAMETNQTNLVNDKPAGVTVKSNTSNPDEIPSVTTNSAKHYENLEKSKSGESLEFFSKTGENSEMSAKTGKSLEINAKSSEMTEISVKSGNFPVINIKTIEIDDEVLTNGMEPDSISMDVDNVCLNGQNSVSNTGISQAEVKPSNSEITDLVKSTSCHSDEFLLVLRWLKEHPPLSDSELNDLYITMEDFKEALTTVQPSAKREGFATVPDVTWDDIGALQDVREELQLAILAPVRHPEQFKSLGLNRAQGVMLAGPPGCGKTLLAKAVANESGINFISVKGPELLNMYVGESERAVRTVFQRARNSSPCVIFFDELDALCPRRSGSSEGNSSARVVNQLLTEMDGLEDRKQVFIMAATNRPDIVDPAVLRPGRLDKTLYVGLPTASDRLDILKCLTKNGTKPLLAKDVNLTEIAENEKANCFTGADLAALVREASIAALKEVIMSTTARPDGPVSVTAEHFKRAFSKVRPSVSAKDQEKYSSMRNRLEIA